MNHGFSVRRLALNGHWVVWGRSRMALYGVPHFLVSHRGNELQIERVVAPFIDFTQKGDKIKLCKAQDSNKIQNFKNFSTYTTLISYHSIIGMS